MRFLRPLFEDALAEEANAYIDKGRVYIRSMHWSAFDVLSGMLGPDALENEFQAWVAERNEGLISYADFFLSEFGVEKRFSRLKRAYLRNRVVPFVGAGLSMSSGYPGWSAFLQLLCRTSIASEEEVEKLLEKGAYEEAAQTIANVLKGGLNEEIENNFGIEHDIEGSVQLLPIVFPGSVITTNYDSVIKRCYEQENVPFSFEITGASANEIRRYFASGERVLLNLHGNYHSSGGRILTSSEYDAHYGNANGLDEVVQATAGANTLLFVGCSMNGDRYMTALEKFLEENGDGVPRHYTFLQNPGDECARWKKQDRLRRANIFPIWYPEGDHEDAISALLLKLWSEE